MVILTRAAETQEVSLDSERQRELIAFHEREALIPIQGAGQVFF